ncbi:MAG: hypothetical protein GX564_02505 [Oligosphaeraceae bacterium]|nr:hypothetical protein [Oligosphaeraceae bacterium]
MDKLSNDLRHPSADWLLQHDSDYPVGPTALQVGGLTLLCDYDCRLDDHNGKAMLCQKMKLFRKAGAAVFSGEGAFPGAGGSTTLRQTIRYAANHARITSDWHWHRGGLIQDACEQGSFFLPGTWRKVFLFPAPADLEQGQTPGWQALPENGVLEFSPLPLLLICANDSGQQLEFGLGDDLWRSIQGLVPQARQILRLTNSRRGLLCQRCIAVAGADQPPLQPEAREYRFTSYLAWSAPALVRPAPDPHRYRPLSFTASGELVRQELLACGDCPSLSLDFRTLPLPRQARRSGDGEICWESKVTQKYVRRIIRQLADYAPQGALLISGGMSPGLCLDGVHCSRRGPTPHWDLLAILDVSTWMRQRLGEQWEIDILQPEPWQSLVSLSCLGASNGFRLLEDRDDDEEEE